MMKYSQVCWISERGWPTGLAVIHHKVGIEERKLLKWYSEKYDMPIESLLISVCQVPVVECPL